MKKTMGLMALLIGSMAAMVPSAVAKDRDDCSYADNGRYYSYTDNYRYRHDGDRREDRGRASDRRGGGEHANAYRTYDNNNYAHGNSTYNNSTRANGYTRGR